MSKKLHIIFSDQLSNEISSLIGIQPHDTVLMCELMEEATYVKHHPKKIAFLFAAMRHFAKTLQEKKIKVRYIKLTDPKNTGTLGSEIIRAAHELKVTSVVFTEPSEYRVKKILELCQKSLGIDFEIRSDDRFLCSIQSFKTWAAGKKQLRMEYFYRQMRIKYNILMEPDGKPVGNQWNYDKDNRKPPKKGLVSPKRIRHKKSPILNEVLSLVSEKFSTHFGNLEPFHYAMTREQAIIELKHFIDHLLPYFGDYQDAMVLGEPYLNHSLLSSYINAGLLLPLEVCKQAENAYRKGKVSLNSAEGFIRQILGWREYVRGIYWLKMPQYAEMNYLEATRPLPNFYWGAKTNMTCISEAVAHTKVHAYSHHIQRLMVTGNFALLSGLDVKAVQEWYLAVYSDAFEWVEMPNTLGMALFGDGGIMASKPYAASGKYINKMSNFCQHCPYDPNEMLGEKACPFNALYWDFLVRNREKLEKNPRIVYIYNVWKKFDTKKQKAIRHKASDTLIRMQDGDL